MRDTELALPNDGKTKENTASCCGAGSGNGGPLEAMNEPKEKILYVLCLQPPELEHSVAGYIATVDADSSSATYGQVGNHQC